MVKSFQNCLFALLIIILSSGALSAKTPVIHILIDRNDTELTPQQMQQREQLAKWWEVDLVNVLTRRGGYEAKLIKTQDEFIEGTDSYLLTSKILNYNPGSKAARMVVGFGAGHCSMDLHNEFYYGENKQGFAKDEHVASGRDWKNVARKHNELILKAIQEFITANPE